MSNLLVLIFAPCFRPDNRALLVFVMERLGVALRVLQDPSEDTLVRNHGPARHSVASNVLQKRGFVEFLAIDQPRSPNERAAGLALSEMYETPPCRRAAANLPVFLSGENFVQPVPLHDQSKLGAPLDAAPPTSRFLVASTIGLAPSPRISFLPRPSTITEDLMKRLAAEAEPFGMHMAPMWCPKKWPEQIEQKHV